MTFYKDVDKILLDLTLPINRKTNYQFLKIREKFSQATATEIIRFIIEDFYKKNCNE